ncbi:Fungalysin/Thermolysin Extracellular metalloproteinase 5 [Dinochytrium kinnereticum]|nr:Fungalysin/Thermolysin Extracellular metalloproteinase 5 [Dinochytrium kinnereticum]
MVNAFYLTNVFHDIMHFYGFTEEAGNFQEKNSGSGGEGGDPIVVFVQDSESTNNAYFAASVDGLPGIMVLYVFDITYPYRDSALDNTVVIHELTHGLSTRLTGGPSQLCLNELESMGLAEGWSDIVALVFGAKSTDTQRDSRMIGTYVLGNAEGVREYPYTTDISVNPLMYGDVEYYMALEAAHSIGTIWATILHEVYWNFVYEHGFTSRILEDSQSTKGNIPVHGQTSPSFHAPAGTYELSLNESYSMGEAQMSARDLESTAVKALADRMTGGDVSRLSVTGRTTSASGTVNHFYICELFSGNCILNKVSLVLVNNNGNILGMSYTSAIHSFVAAQGGSGLSALQAVVVAGKALNRTLAIGKLTLSGSTVNGAPFPVKVQAKSYLSSLNVPVRVFEVRLVIEDEGSFLVVVSMTTGAVVALAKTSVDVFVAMVCSRSNYHHFANSSHSHIFKCIDDTAYTLNRNYDQTSSHEASVHSNTHSHTKKTNKASKKTRIGAHTEH